LRLNCYGREKSDLHAAGVGEREETRWWGIAEEAGEEGEGEVLAEEGHGMWWSWVKLR